MTHYDLVPGQRYNVSHIDYVNGEDGDWLYDPNHEINNKSKETTKITNIQNPLQTYYKNCGFSWDKEVEDFVVNMQEEIKKKNKAMDSYVTNCNLILRDPKDILFHTFFYVGRTVIAARLDGYTILPNEQYDEMKDFMEREGSP